MNTPTSAKLEITFEVGKVTTAIINPDQAVKILQGMRAGTIARPLPEFKNALISEETVTPEAE